MTRFLFYEQDKKVAHFFLISPDHPTKKTHQIATLVSSSECEALAQELTPNEEVVIKIENSPKGTVAGITLVSVASLEARATVEQG